MSVTNLAAFPRGCSSDPGRRPSAWAHRRAVLPLLEGSTSLSVCINPTCASSRSSSSVSICLIPLEQTRVTRPMSPQTVAFPLKQTLAFRWKRFSLRKVCLVPVNSWKCGSNHAGAPAGRWSPWEPSTRASVQVSVGCWALPSGQTRNQLLQLFICPRPVQRVEA